MTAWVFEGYGILCFLSLIAFLVLAAVAKLRPDLDEEEFDLNSDQFGEALSIEPAFIEESSGSPPPRLIKQSKRLIQRRPHLIHMHKHRTI